MANVLQHPIEFHPRPVNHAPSPFGFGFGLGTPFASPTTNAWHQGATPGHTNPAAFQQLASSTQSSFRAQKRRHDGDDDGGERQGHSRDASMDRSPTPERPKRSAPKRARVNVPGEHSQKEETSSKGSKTQIQSDNQDIDVGMLLASLPSQSLLPLLNSLLIAQPSLKPLMLQLIPRPSIDTVLEALAQSARRLRDAYPYSSSIPPFGNPNQHNTSTSFGFNKPMHASNTPTFGLGSSNMRDSYITSRLRPHIREFTSTCFSYLPYFTQQPESSQLSDSQSQPKELPNPSETFLLLSAISNHILSQPPLGQASLAQAILPRLLEEWKAWVTRIDNMVNQEGRMFGRETVQSWERTLDSMAEAKVPPEMTILRDLRDAWVSKVGWLVGRTIQQSMLV